MKICPTCGISKSTEFFYRNKSRKDGCGYECKECCKAIGRYRYWTNPDQKADNQLRNRYGISLEDYSSLFEKQDGCCAICNERKEKRLSVDHNHTTGSIRGLLCNNCNRGLGFFKDDLRILDLAIKYLASYSGVDKPL